MIPCPDCCTTDCTIAEDDFDRADSGTVTGWTEVSGTWDIASNKLACTSASAVATNDGSALNTPALGVHLQADVTCASTTDAARLIAEYTDSNNYWFAEVQPGATDGTLKIFQRAVGSNTQRGLTVPVPGFSAGDTVTLEFCMSDEGFSADRVWARVGSNRTAYRLAGFTTTSNKCGVGTGSGSSDVEFDNFLMKTHAVDDSACPDCGTFCHGGTTVGEEIQLDFTGFANGGGCVFCASLNTTFIVTANAAAAQLTNEADGCLWAGGASGVGCTSLSAVDVRLSVFVVSGVYYIRARIWAPPNVYAEFSLNMGSTAEPDLTALSGTSIPLLATGVLCNSASATCTATYLG